MQIYCDLFLWDFIIHVIFLVVEVPFVYFSCLSGNVFAGDETD